MEELAGDKVIEVRFAPALLTVTVAELPKAPERAVTVTTPVATPVATPAGLTVATFESDELHVTEDVRSFVVPSENIPVAWRETVPVVAIDVAPGVTARPVREAELGWPPEPGWFLTPLQAASSTQNERIQSLIRTCFLRGIESRVDRGILFWADTIRRLVKRSGRGGTAGCAFVSVLGLAE